MKKEKEKLYTDEIIAIKLIFLYLLSIFQEKKQRQQQQHQNKKIPVFKSY